MFIVPPIRFWPNALPTGHSGGYCGMSVGQCGSGLVNIRASFAIAYMLLCVVSIGVYCGLQRRGISEVQAGIPVY